MGYWDKFEVTIGYTYPDIPVVSDTWTFEVIKPHCSSEIDTKETLREKIAYFMGYFISNRKTFQLNGKDIMDDWSKIEDFEHLVVINWKQLFENS